MAKTKQTGQSRKSKQSPSVQGHVGWVDLQPEWVDAMRQQIITVLWEKEQLTETDLYKQVKASLGPEYPGPFDQYFRHVLDSFHRFGLLETITRKKNLLLRLTQRTESRHLARVAEE